MLTPKQYKLLMFIDNSIKENGCCPSFEEMKQAVGIKSKSGIHALIEELIERDFIKKLPHQARALEVLRIPRFKPREIIEEEKKIRQALQGAAIQIPLYGKIAAGTPIAAIADENESITVPLNMVSRGKFYALTVEGESMIEAGINDGDYVIVKEQQVANNGEIIVALIEDGATVKRFYKEADHIRLQPENSSMEPIIVRDCAIVGKVVAVMRRVY